MPEPPLTPETVAGDLEGAAFLIQLERQGFRVQLDLGPFGLMVVIIGLQLAWRHPELADSPTRAHWRDIAEQMIAGIPHDKIRAALGRAWDLEGDITAEEFAELLGPPPEEETSDR